MTILNVKQLRTGVQSRGCSPLSYGGQCLYGGAVCVWLWRPAQPKHGHDLHPETGEKLANARGWPGNGHHDQPTVLIGDRSGDLRAGSQRDRSFLKWWQVAKGGHPDVWNQDKRYILENSSGCKCALKYSVNIVWTFLQAKLKHVFQHCVNMSSYIFKYDINMFVNMV